MEQVVGPLMWAERAANVGCSYPCRRGGQISAAPSGADGNGKIGEGTRVRKIRGYGPT